METIARQRSHHPRRAFHSISHVARVWFLGGLVFCPIAVAVVVVCVEPRGGPASPIGVLDIQMTAVMRREFGTAEPPSSEVELGRGRANGLVHVHFLPPVGRSLFDKHIQKPLSFGQKHTAPDLYNTQKVQILLTKLRAAVRVVQGQHRAVSPGDVTKTPHCHCCSGLTLFLAFAVHLAALAGPEADLAVWVFLRVAKTR